MAVRSRVPTKLKISAGKVASIVQLLRALVTPQNNEDFFTVPPGIFVPATNGVVKIGDGGPVLEPFAASQRLRRPGIGCFDPHAPADPPADSLFGKFVARLFYGDPNKATLTRLVRQMYGVALAGCSPRLKQPKAFFLVGPRNSGKSTLLRILRRMFPERPKVVGTFSIADLSSDQGRHIPQLKGILLNVCDEKPDASELRTETFKALIDGGFKRGREVAQPAVEIKGEALHVFSMNSLMDFPYGIDGGLQRRLVVVPFELCSVIRDDEVVENLHELIVDKEADLVLRWAVEGIAEVVRNGDYAIPEVCHEALMAHVTEDIVAAWAFNRLAACNHSEPPVLGRDLLADLHRWAAIERYASSQLPKSPAIFGKRLRELLESKASPVPGVRIKTVNGRSTYRGLKISPRQD